MENRPVAARYRHGQLLTTKRQHKRVFWAGRTVLYPDCGGYPCAYPYPRIYPRVKLQNLHPVSRIPTLGGSPW